MKDWEALEKRLNKGKNVLSAHDGNDGRLYDFWNMELWGTAREAANNPDDEKYGTCWDLMDSLLNAHAGTGSYLGNFAYAERTRGLGRYTVDKGPGPRRYHKDRRTSTPGQLRKLGHKDMQEDMHK